MGPEEFERRIVTWLQAQSDLVALVLAGSRATGSVTDRWSDWDFHLISTNPRRYQNCDWLSRIAPVWAAHSERTPRGVIKVSAVFEGGMEADFVPLASWQMKLVYFAMRRPQLAGLMPLRLHRGIQETRAFLLGSGYRVLIGGADWEERISIGLQVPWAERRMSSAEFETHAAAFWQKAVWVFKKIARPEPRSALHWLHKLVLEHVYAMLAEEARLAHRTPRPEARKAEHWLSVERLEATGLDTSLDQRVLARALSEQLTLFEDASRVVAEQRGFKTPDYSAVAGWLRAELQPLLGR